jgi:hypothetical protein
MNQLDKTDNKPDRLENQISFWYAEWCPRWFCYKPPVDEVTGLF